jgi:caffeoyl-CoA O-methyltransferase
MRRTLFAVALIGLAGLAGLAGWNLNRVFGKEAQAVAAQSRSPAEAKILTEIQRMRAEGRIHLGVPEADGRRLRLLAEAIGAKNVVEVGTSTGYSGLWLALGVLPTEGHITTLEIDAGRAAQARESFRRAGVERLITVVVGDAHKTVTAIQGPVDLVFMDADKDGYVDYLEKLLPLVRPGGLIVAHNANYAPAYLERVSGRADLETVFLTQGSSMAVTLKKR